MPSPLFTVTGLRIAIRRGPDERVVVDGVDLAVETGETLALIGESASGKSLIALGAIDLLSPGAKVVAGTTTFGGEMLQNLAEADWRRLVGMGIGVLFQDAIGAWDPLDLMGMQSGEVLDEHTELTDLEIQDRVLDALGEVGLHGRRHFLAYSHEVSRGQAQRAMLAAALLAAPRLLIADEPLSGLDITVARAVLDLIDDLRRKRGMGMLLVTHDLAIVASVADRVAVVYAGMIVEEAAVAALYHRPRHPYTSGLLGSIPGLTVGRLRPIRGEAPDIFDVARGCPFAPRCDHAVDRCRVERPELRLVGESMVACHRAEELDLPGVG
jgi:oligopeptide/dipeptide ABC transporter ATP-binding protein